jgi:hypothetical protein
MSRIESLKPCKALQSDLNIRQWVLLVKIRRIYFTVAGVLLPKLALSWKPFTQLWSLSKVFATTLEDFSWKLSDNNLESL